MAIKLSRQVRYLVITPYGHQDLAQGATSTINTNAHDMATLTVAILTMAGARRLHVHQRLASEHLRAGSDRARREVR